MSSSRKVKNLIVNIIVSLTTVCILFLLAELTLRTITYFESRKSFERLMQNLDQPENGIAKHLGQLIQPSRYPGIIYELRPNFSAIFQNVLVKTNIQGFRMGPLSSIKGKNTVRIVGLGDSHMFGWGVPQEKMYMNVLENTLNAKFPQKKWEVINTGVPGYNTYMEIETLSKKALMYDPDIVIMEFIGNDLDLPNFLMESPDCFSVTRSFFLDFLKLKIKRIEAEVGLVSAPLELKEGANGVCGPVGIQDLRKVPTRYRDMCGFPAFQKAMIKLKKMQEKKNFEVVICFSQDLSMETGHNLVELCKRLKFHVLIDILTNAPSLVLSKVDLHPNELGHKQKAEALAGFIISEKVIDKYIYAGRFKV